MRMTLGNYTFSRNPNKAGIVTPTRFTAKVMTYTGVAFFSWGASLIGKEIQLVWDKCENTQYDAMETIYVNDLPVLWKPQDNTGKQYQVQVTNLTGDLFMYLKAKNHWVQNVSMNLLLLDQGTVA